MMMKFPGHVHTTSTHEFHPTNALMRSFIDQQVDQPIATFLQCSPRRPTEVSSLDCAGDYVDVWELSGRSGVSLELPKSNSHYYRSGKEPARPSVIETRCGSPSRSI